MWTASALCGPLIGGAFATAGLWRLAFRPFALKGLVLAALVHLLLARAGPDSALQAWRNPHARVGLVAGAILAISSAGAVGSASAAGALVLAGCVCPWSFAARDTSQPTVQRQMLCANRYRCGNPDGEG